MCKRCIERLTLPIAILNAVITDIQNEEAFGKGVIEPLIESEIGADTLEDKIEIYEEMNYLLN